MITHSNTFEPNPRLITPEFANDGALTNPGPLKTFHAPEPMAGVLAPKVAVVAQTV